MVGLSRRLEGSDLRLAQAALLREFQRGHGQMRRTRQLMLPDPPPSFPSPLRGGVRGGGHARCLRSSSFAHVTMRQVIETAQSPIPTLWVDPPRQGEGKVAHLWIAFVTTLFVLTFMAAQAIAADLATEIKSLDTSNFAQKEKAIAAIAATGDARVADVL